MKTTVTCEKLPPAEPETVDWEYVRTHEGVYRNSHKSLFISVRYESHGVMLFTTMGGRLYPCSMSSWTEETFRRVTNERITITIEV